MFFKIKSSPCPLQGTHQPPSPLLSSLADIDSLGEGLRNLHIYQVSQVIFVHSKVFIIFSPKELKDMKYIKSRYKLTYTLLK